MARVAIMFNGEPRNVPGTYECFRDIIEENQADVFVHSYIDPEMYGKRYRARWLIEELRVTKGIEWTGYSSEETPHNVDSIILEKFQPKRHLFERPMDFEIPDFIYELKNFSTIPNDDYRQMRSFYQVNQLKKQVEQEEGFVYDVVLRVRMGMRFNSKLPPLKFFAGNNHVIFTPCSWTGFNRDPETFWLGNVGMLDHWNIASSPVMDTYCDVYNHIEDAALGCQGFQMEYITGYWTRVMNQIQQAAIDVSYCINCA